MQNITVDTFNALAAVIVIIVSIVAGGLFVGRFADYIVDILKDED
jgi:hypothetical protein